MVEALDKRPLEKVSVGVGELKGPSGTLPADTVDVRVAQMSYVHIGVDGIIMLVTVPAELVTWTLHLLPRSASCAAFRV